MPQTDAYVRAAGIWLGVGAVLLAAVLAFHGPLAPDLESQMRAIAGEPARWAVVHWAAAGALSLLAVGSLLVLASRSRLAETWWTASAWAVLAVGALWTVTTAVAEATSVADAAASGNASAFAAWWAYSEGNGHGFAFVALAVALIAGNEARTPGAAMPRAVAWVGVVVGVGSFLGWALSSWFGVGAASLLWVAASLVMCLWLLWFAVTLPRAAAP